MHIDYKSIYGEWAYPGELMIDPTRTALVIIDMQASMMSTKPDGYLRAYSMMMPVDLTYFMDRCKQVVTPTIRRLLEFFREHKRKIVHVWCSSDTTDLSDIPPASG